MPVDPWGGTNQGLANLGATFDDLNARGRQRALDARTLAFHQEELDRRAREEARLERAEARQKALDALDEPYKKARNAEAELTLDEKRRSAARLKDYETEYAALGNGPVSTLEAVPNPDYVPPRAATPLSAIANRTRANALAVASEGDPGAMAVDTSMLPTGQTAAVGSPVVMKAGTRPMSNAEQMQQRIALAIKHGQYDDLAKMGTAYDLSDRLRTEAGQKLATVAKVVNEIRDNYGPDVARELAPQIALGYGIKPDTFEKIDFDNDGGVIKQAPNGNWYRISANGNTLHEFKPNVDYSMKGVNDFTTFYRGEKEKDPTITDAEISQRWHAMKTAEAMAIGQSRIPAYSTAGGMPPGYVLNRRTGDYEWKGDGSAPGVSPESAATYKADSSSLAFQQKSRDMMSGFVANMNKQVDRLKVIANDVSRFDARLMNVPLVELRQRVAGSPLESKVAMYVTEISNEIGKISTGSSASVRELSQSAQEKWDKIHDSKLSMKDLISLLEETKHAGLLRIESSDAEIAAAKQRLRGSAAPTTTGGNSFATEAEAVAAAKSGKIKPGDKITVGGKSGTWR